MARSGAGHNDRVIVDCALYRHGQRVTESRNLAKMVNAARADPESFVWMGLFEPTDTDLVGVARLFGIHPLALEDAVKAHQRPKLEVYGDAVFLVLRTIWYEADTEAIETGELMVFLGEGFVVTVRHGQGGGLEALRRRLEQDGRLAEHGPAAVVHAICDVVVDRYMEVAAEVETDVEEIETQVFGPERFKDTQRVYLLKRELLEFRRAVHPLERALDALVHDESLPGIPAALRPFFRDVLDHQRRVADTLESFDRQLADIVQAHLAQLGLEQNDDMRKISAWAAMALVPTMIAGIYGMNFVHMPELHWVLGYPMAIGVMAVVCTLLYRRFKRSGWL
jgi:magnesium transporter